MKLYDRPSACSLSQHIVLRESGLAFEPVLADLKSDQLGDATKYYGVNLKGDVPRLELDSGERLSEGPAIVQYIADQVPEKKLALKRVGGRMKWVDERLASKDDLLGSDFSVADAYLFTVASWAPHVGLDLGAMANLQAFQARVAVRPAVQAALNAEGLMT